MTPLKILHHQPKREQQVTTGRFELEHDGKVAYLDYSLAGNILGLIHTEVPEELRKHGMAAKLAEAAFQYAREHNLKVDVICPSVQHYLAAHPEYADLILR